MYFEEIVTEVKESFFFASVLLNFWFVVLDFVHGLFVSQVLDVWFSFFLLVCFEFINITFEFFEVYFCEFLSKFFFFASLLIAKQFELFIYIDFGDVNVLPTFHDVFSQFGVGVFLR